jgi:ADP-ribosylglycohydrolase
LCALRYPFEIERALRMAVTHTGDSDSTGAICGNLLGAMLGVEALPERWLAAVELRDVILQVADDLHDARTLGVMADSYGRTPADAWTARYPPV